MDVDTILTGVTLDEHTRFADVSWNGAPLALVEWSQVPVLGDELVARKTDIGYEPAVRANRQLAVALQTQGLNEQASHYALKAFRLRRRSLWRDALLRREGRPATIRTRASKLLGFLWSGLLDGLAGYGYRPLHSAMAYLVIIALFAGAYFVFGPSQGTPMSPLGSLVFSVTSFHGRGFFPGGSPGHSITLDDPLTVLAASEAVVGLIVEVSFIAAFTQRFFTR